MYRIIIIENEDVKEEEYKPIRKQEEMNQIEIIGVISINGEEQQIQDNYDYIVVMNDACFPLARKLAGKDAEDIIIEARVFKVAGFQFQKYLDYKASKQTIFSIHCWGALTSHSLGLEFLSPLINMWEKEEDYLRFLDNPKKYIDMKPELLKYRYVPEFKFTYPILKLGDISLHCNHYKTYEEAFDKWEERKKRINWDNLFVMMFTEKEEYLEKFCKLPYEKKVCFVPFETSLPNAIYVDLVKQEKLKEKPFWWIVVSLSMGRYTYYDVLELLNGNIKLI